MVEGIMGTLELFGGVLSFIDKNKDKELRDIKFTNAQLEMIETNGSMVKFLNKFIIEPTFIVSESLKDEEITQKLIEFNLDVFGSYYMQSFDVMTKLYGVDADVAFDTLSTQKRNAPYVHTKARTIANRIPGMEDFKTLPIKDSSEYYYSLEGDKKQKGSGKAIVGNDVKWPSTFAKEMRIDIMINKNNNPIPVSIPVLLKANIIYTPVDSITRVLDVRGDDTSFWNRLDDYRSGAISLGNFIFADDLIKRYKAAKFKDKDELLQYIDERTYSANYKTLNNGLVGFNKYFSSIFLSKYDLQRVEHALQGKVKIYKYREKLMEYMKAMMTNVIDADYERITLYTKDMREDSDFSFKALERKGSKDETMLEIFKMVLGNKAPVI